MWQTKKMNSLTAEEFYQILKLRIDTFVVAQKRIYHELDDKDPIAYHVFCQNEDKMEVLAYTRVFLEDDHVTFGRVVTSLTTRGTGMGAKMMTEVLALCQHEWPSIAVKIEAQQQVVGFYEKFNFKTVGEPFIFEGTPHVEMVHLPY